MTRKTVDISEATAHFPEILEDVEQGIFIFVKKDDKIIAEISPYNKRLLGLHKGSVVCRDDFDDELPEEFWVGK